MDDQHYNTLKRKGGSINSMPVKRGFAPNLAAAGRIEEPSLPSSSQQANSSSKTPKRQKVERGQKPQRNISKDKRNYFIQSEGVFSQGFSDDLDSRRKRRATIKGEEKVIGKLDVGIESSSVNKIEQKHKQLKVKEATEGTDSTDFVDSSRYSHEWISDHEQDEEALSELLRDDFISGLKRCDQKPKVLPAKDNQQFRKLVSKKSTKHGDLMQHHNHSLHNSVKNIKNELVSEESERDEMPSTSTTGETDKYLEAGRALRSFLSTDATKPLALFQLPLFDLNFLNSEPSQTSSPPITSQPSLLEQQQHSKPKILHCLEHFPAGSRIGKLQILRSGRVTIEIAGRRMDMAEAIPSNCYETAVQIETQADSTPPAAESQRKNYLNSLELLESSSKTPSQSISTTSSKFGSSCLAHQNTAQVFGEIPYHFICSSNFGDHFPS